MTEPQVPALDPSAALASAAPPGPAAQYPAAAAPRRRRRWPVVTLAAVVVVATLAAGLAVWAPWTQPPVLRPAGLAVGPATANVVRCGTPGNTIPDPGTLKYRVHATAAAGQGQAWAATSLTGTLVATLRYVSSSAFYCPASTFKATLTGTPA